jgi:hypothetical protein
MNLAKISNQPDLSQEQVCITLRQMDKLLANMLTLIMQCSKNHVEHQLAHVAGNYIRGKNYRSPVYHRDISKWVFSLLKLKYLKSIRTCLKIIKEVEFTRDILMHIVEYFLEDVEHYEKLVLRQCELSNFFYEDGSNSKEFNNVTEKILEIENNIGSFRRESIFGCIRNVKVFRERFYELRNSIVLAYLKLNLGMACRIPSVRVEDNYQNGVLGIMHAINKSRVNELEQKIFSFVNFVKFHIKNATASLEFNPRTDLACNISSQKFEHNNFSHEQYIDNIFESRAYVPEYLQDDEPEPEYENDLNKEEKKILALLSKKPEVCELEPPLEEQIQQEILRQLDQ